MSALKFTKIVGVPLAACAKVFPKRKKTTRKKTAILAAPHTALFLFSFFLLAKKLGTTSQVTNFARRHNKPIRPRPAEQDNVPWADPNPP